MVELVSAATLKFLPQWAITDDDPGSFLVTCESVAMASQWLHPNGQSGFLHSSLRKPRQQTRDLTTQDYEQVKVVVLDELGLDEEIYHQFFHHKNFLLTLPSPQKAHPWAIAKRFMDF